MSRYAVRPGLPGLPGLPGRGLLLVEETPDLVEDLLRDDAGEQAGADADRHEDKLHGRSIPTRTGASQARRRGADVNATLKARHHTTTVE